MKILHLPSTFLPDSVGGKEIFVNQLIANCPDTGVEHVVLIHGNQAREYAVNDIKVVVLPSPVSSNARRWYFTKVYDSVPGFESFLRSFCPDLVHFHDQGDGASLTHLRICGELGIKTLITYHSPGQSCLQHALLQDGKSPCDGVIDFQRCTECRYRVAGLPKVPASMLSRVAVRYIDPTGIALKRNSTTLYYESWFEFYRRIDAIQVHARWVTDLLVRNRVPMGKIHMIEMGGHRSLPSSVPRRDGPLRIVYVGRCTDIKGVHLLIDAVKSLPASSDVVVHFIGSWPDSSYATGLREKIEGDHRFMKPIHLEQDQMISELEKMDVCVIPSLWPETGPFTLFDAFAAHVPVIGTRLAGIEERVTEGVDGLLFNWNDVDDLRRRLEEIIGTEGLLARLKTNIKPNRTFSEMSEDMHTLYKKIIDG